MHCDPGAFREMRPLAMLLLVGLRWHGVGHQQAAQIHAKCNTIVTCWSLLVSSWSPRSCSDTCKIQCDRYLLDSFGIQSVTNKRLRYVQNAIQSLLVGPLGCPIGHQQAAQIRENTIQSLLVGLFGHAVVHQQAAQIRVKDNAIVGC